MAQRRFQISVQHPLVRAESSTMPRLPLGDKNLGNTKRGATRSKDKNLRATSPKDQNLGATSSKVKKKNKTIPNLQGCGQTEIKTDKDHGHRPTFKGAVKTKRNKTKTKRQRRLPTSKGEANEARFYFGIYFYVCTKHPTTLDVASRAKEPEQEVYHAPMC